MNAFDGVKVFSATQYQDRDQLGEWVTVWIAAHPEITVVDLVIRQSSDYAFHCITISVFYRGVLVARPGGRRATTSTRGDR